MPVDSRAGFETSAATYWKFVWPMMPVAVKRRVPGTAPSAIVPNAVEAGEMDWIASVPGGLGSVRSLASTLTTTAFVLAASSLKKSASGSTRPTAIATVPVPVPPAPSEAR